MSIKSQTLPIFRKITFAILIILFVLPMLYAVVYRPADYFLCRSFVSMRLGRGFSPYTLENYVQETLSPGMTRDEVVSKLDEVGRIRVFHLGTLDGKQIDQINLQICTDPFNRMIIFTNYSDVGTLISTKIADD